MDDKGTDMDIQPVETALREAENQTKFDLAFTRTFMVLSCPYTQKTWPAWKTTDLKGKKVLVSTDQQEEWVRQTNGIPVRAKKISEKAVANIATIDRKASADTDADISSQDFANSM
jgi:hypothetical protein